jgi:hypothetical protein
MLFPSQTFPEFGNELEGIESLAGHLFFFAPTGNLAVHTRVLVRHLTAPAHAKGVLEGLLV